ncbi:MAG TPA: hypothetical protein VJN94_17510, partial [Candidatus Binataceae bacterium]|nr:hypothetical protein [Candidatus Binataceae bacterium]
MTRSRNVEPAGSIPDRGAQESAGPRAFTGQARHRFPKSELMAAATLALAVAAGGYLRFAHLGARELSADEGASWAAASLSSVAQIVRQQPLLNPGKLALHDLALHVWMRLLGDSLYAMRSLSALAGTVAIIAVFLVTRELFSAADSPVLATHESRNDPHDLLSAFDALLFAVNLVTIKYSQEA